MRTLILLTIFSCFRFVARAQEEVYFGDNKRKAYAAWERANEDKLVRTPAGRKKSDEILRHKADSTLRAEFEADPKLRLISKADGAAIARSIWLGLEVERSRDSARCYHDRIKAERDADPHINIEGQLIRVALWDSIVKLPSDKQEGWLRYLRGDTAFVPDTSPEYIEAYKKEYPSN